MDTASLLGEVSNLVPALLSKQDVICLDSSGDEDEKVDTTLPALAIRDGRIYDSFFFFQVLLDNMRNEQTHTAFVFVMTQM